MEKQRTYRHEYKFLIDERDRADLFYRIRNLIPLDSHVGENGKYWIRSVYFDDFQNSCYLENEDGINERAKYRIRIYNASDERITLERKSKKNGMTCKEAAKLTKEECNLFLDGKALPMSGSRWEEAPAVLKQFNILVTSRGFRPKTIVEYERTPFIYDLGNVRITFDENISSSMDVKHFFEKDAMRYPVLRKGQLLMEVKYDEYLPTFIKDNLDTGKLQQISFSKYYLGRKYTIPCVGGRLQ